MVSIGISSRYSFRFVYVASYVRKILLLLWGSGGASSTHNSQFTRRDEASGGSHVAFIVLIPVLVLLSGLFAGLTLGYMSLDETQLNVLSISGTEKQREYAKKIIPIRKNGHLLLVTLLLANMVVNESLPIITEPVLGGGAQSIVVSTVLIVIFAEIIPQSLFTRHGLYLGAKMAWFTQILIYLLGIVSWPVAKLLELALGPHHGIIYRRAELKELIALHSSHSAHGGDLKTDTVTIIGATLDLQEKVVRQAMTPIGDVFMLSIEAKLDYDLLRKICLTGHSRVPVYEEVDVPLPEDPNMAMNPDGGRGRARTQRVKKIIGILLVKQCLLLDPNDSVPIRMLPLNKVPFVPQNEPLLGILDKFQEGRSHMAIVSRFSRENAASVKKAVKRGLTQRLRQRVGMGDTDSSSDSDDEKEHEKKPQNERKKKWKRKIKDIEEGSEDSEDSPQPPSRHHLSPVIEKDFAVPDQEEMQKKQVKIEVPPKEKDKDEPKSRRASFQLPRAAAISALEQSMPADAVLTKEGAEEFLQGFDPAVHPLGIITLEDVLEELIGEEIYDEFDTEGAHGDPLPSAGTSLDIYPTTSTDATLTVPSTTGMTKPSPVLKPLALKGLGFLRSRSAPPTPRDANKSMAGNIPLGKGGGDGGAAVASEEVDEKAAGTGATNLSRSDSQKNSTGAVAGGTSDEATTTIKIEAPTPISVKAPTPTPTNTQFPPHLATAVSSTPVSRSASPAPSLEAILLDRKRRQVAAGAGIVSPSPVSATPSPPGPGGTTSPNVNLAVPQIALTRSGASNSGIKGARFKSSPLVGERAGVVVADNFRGGAPHSLLETPPSTATTGTTESSIPQPKGSNDETRIPDGKDKVGPDKTEGAADGS